ncbi:hypothetical protein MMC22_002243 [Lobaria immixta]|nr:hypothetical protein [Lobaria immixta]
MWTLECDDPVLKDKRLWLRPGKKYLFGRTEPKGQDGFMPKGEDVDFRISGKSVSRKHITILVSAVKSGEGSLVHTRSELTFRDEGAKYGTEIDGERISDATKILKNDEHVFKLGKTPHSFRIKWQPVVLSFSFSSKEVKGGKDPLIAIRDRLEDLDIKAVLPYLYGQTTHVVSSKRNTAKGLQALINAKYIVAEPFIDALVYVTTPENLDEPESLSPLEMDFDGHWPNELDYLPAKSKEPNERPPEFFAPNTGRNNIFEGYTFIFCDQVQFETLEAPVQHGGGKALHFSLDPGKTSVEELTRYVKNAAGEKGLGEFEDGSEGKGVVLVRFRGKKEYQDWAIDLGDQLALALNQRMIEQSEFMDAILTNSTGMLRRPLQEADEQDSGTLRAKPQARDDLTVEETRGPEVSQPPPRRKRTRGPIVSRFKGFDSDSDDPPEVSSLRDQQGVQERSISSIEKSQPASSSRSIENSVMVDSQRAEIRTPQARNPRKRSIPPSDEESEEEMVDKLLPAAAAMKRRKIEEEEEARRKGVAPATSFSKTQSTVDNKKPKKQKQEVDIKGVVRERREAEEDAARRDEESLRETLDGMDVEEMKNLAVVEEMQIPIRPNRPQRNQTNGASDSRWDDQWNGRKNFKKFRRQGESNQVRRGQSVIVPLEEVKKKAFDGGADYLVESEITKKTRKEKEHATHPESQGEQPFSTARSQNAEVPAELVDGDEPEVIDVEAPRTLRTMDLDKGRSSRSQAANGKRFAPSAAKAPVAKRQKTFAMREADSDSDSEDELKFRFKKKK